jgi:hypothetical protein
MDSKEDVNHIAICLACQTFLDSSKFPVFLVFCMNISCFSINNLNVIILCKKGCQKLDEFFINFFICLIFLDSTICISWFFSFITTHLLSLSDIEIQNQCSGFNFLLLIKTLILAYKIVLCVSVCLFSLMWIQTIRSFWMTDIIDFKMNAVFNNTSMLCV